MIAKAPMRISLFGGGSDLPMYRELTGSGGCVLSCTIDKYVTVKPVAVYADAPAGSGLGGSGAFHVASLLHDHPHLSGHALFAAAWDREVDYNRHAGWQDCAASVFGGLNLFTFEEELKVEPIPVPRGLDERLLLFSTGVTRQASEPLALQAEQMAANHAAIRATTFIAGNAAKELARGWHRSIGSLLDWTWEFKRTLPGVTTPAIDHAYDAARNAGAVGGKLCGAGGGGYLLFFVEPDAQASVRAAMAGLHLDELVFSLTTQGAELV